MIGDEVFSSIEDFQGVIVGNPFNAFIHLLVKFILVKGHCNRMVVAS